LHVKAELLTLQLGLLFHGSIDQVRISKGIRYTSDFDPSPHFESDRETLALYRFDEGTGNVLHDTSGNDRHGKIQDAVWIDLTPKK